MLFGLIGGVRVRPAELPRPDLDTALGPACDCAGVDQDGDTDVRDFATLQTYYGTPCGQVAGVAAGARGVLNRPAAQPASQQARRAILPCARRSRSN